MIQFFTLAFIATMILVNGALGLYYVEKTTGGPAHALLVYGHLLISFLFTLLWVFINR